MSSEPYAIPPKDRAFEGILWYIKHYDLQSGDRLPAERVLCEELGASRTALRAAITRLISCGTLESRRGSGTYVCLIHAAEWNAMGHKRMTEKSVVLTASESGTTPEVLEAVGKMREMGVRVFAMTNPEGKIGQAVGAENCVKMASDHGAGGCEMGYYLADCFGLRLLNRRGCFPKFDLFIEQTKDVWKDMLDIRKRFEPRAEELARKYALADYTMFIGSGALWGETILYSMCLLEEMQWKRIRHITSHDFFHGTLELLEPGVPVFLFMGEDECRALDERVRAFLTSGVTGDEDYVIIDTAEYAIPGLDDDFRVIVSPWILSVLTTDRLVRNYELVTKHNLKYRRYYHQFDY